MLVGSPGSQVGGGGGEGQIKGGGQDGAGGRGLLETGASPTVDPP